MSQVYALVANGARARVRSFFLSLSSSAVREGRPSFTARRVAAQRARLTRPAGPEGDPGAEQRLYAGLQQGRLLPHLDSRRIAGRTRWFDGATVDALARGVGQV